MEENYISKLKYMVAAAYINRHSQGSKGKKIYKKKNNTEAKQHFALRFHSNYWFQLKSLGLLMCLK